MTTTRRFVCKGFMEASTLFETLKILPESRKRVYFGGGRASLKLTILKLPLVLNFYSN